MSHGQFGTTGSRAPMRDVTARAMADLTGGDGFAGGPAGLRHGRVAEPLRLPAVVVLVRESPLRLVYPTRPDRRGSGHADGPAVGRWSVLGRLTRYRSKEITMLSSASVTANIPAADLDRARSFYADTLGMTPSSEMADAGMLVYRTEGGTTFQVYQTEFAGQAGHTIAQFHVDDVEGEARSLQDKGVELETYDMPGVTWDNGVADMGGIGKAAWFKDSEGNILCIDSGYPEG
jgi:predicted enzyme related to lactoylglutathione lyase